MAFLLQHNIKSDCFRLRSIICGMRGWFLTSTSNLAMLAAFPVFQEPINYCTQWLSAGESLDRWPPQGLYGHGKYLGCNMDIVEWFTKLLAEI